MADIFVSYASEDRERVRSLVESLEMQNWTVWWDRQITPGIGFADEIDREIRNASCIVVIWSKHSIVSRWVKSEALEAMEREVLVPIKLEDVRIPVAFKQIQTVNLIGWPETESKEEYPALMSAIASFVNTRSDDIEALEETPNSICVRPFQNMTRDPEHEFLADGITEDIITALSHMNDTFVVASNTSFTLGEDRNSSEIGIDLGVKYVLEGSVRPMGSKIRVTARLMDAAQGLSIFSNHYDQPAEDFHLLQDDLVNGIVSKMGWQLLASDRDRVRKLPIEQLNARNLLIRATLIENALSASGRVEALDLHNRALSIAPDYPRALAQKALILGGGTSNMLSSDIDSDRREVRELAQKAIRLAPGDAQIHAMAGMAHGLAAMYDEAIELLEQAQELAPGLPFSFAGLGYAYIMSGRDIERGITLVAEGIRRDPLNPRLNAHYQWQALGEGMLGRYDDAIETIRKSIRRNPLYPWAWINLATWLLRTHQNDEARKSLAQARRVNPGLNLKNIEESTVLTSGPEMAKRLVARLQTIWE